MEKEWSPINTHTERLQTERKKKNGQGYRKCEKDTTAE